MRVIILIIGFWLGQGIESLILNLGWIKYSYNEMFYNFIIMFIFIMIYLYGENRLNQIKKSSRQEKKAVNSK